MTLRVSQLLCCLCVLNDNNVCFFVIKRAVPGLNADTLSLIVVGLRTKHLPAHRLLLHLRTVACRCVLCKPGFYSTHVSDCVKSAGSARQSCSRTCSHVVELAAATAVRCIDSPVFMMKRQCKRAAYHQPALTALATGQSTPHVVFKSYCAVWLAQEGKWAQQRSLAIDSTRLSNQQAFKGMVITVSSTTAAAITPRLQLRKTNQRGPHGETVWSFDSIQLSITFTDLELLCARWLPARCSRASHPLHGACSRIEPTYKLLKPVQCM